MFWLKLFFFATTEWTSGSLRWLRCITGRQRKAEGSTWRNWTSSQAQRNHSYC